MSMTLMAICPQCRIEVTTGISADDQTMHELGPKLEVLLLCGSCREYQRVMVKDRYFADATREAAAAESVICDSADSAFA